VFSGFSRKARIDELKAMQKAIDTQLRTFTNHLRVIQQAFDILAKQSDDLKAQMWKNHNEIVKLLKEKNKNGQ
jgi:hypothetical protein